MKRLLTTAVALTFLALGLTGAPAAHATTSSRRWASSRKRW